MRNAPRAADLPEGLRTRSAERPREVVRRRPASASGPVLCCVATPSFGFSASTRGEQSSPRNRLRAIAVSTGTTPTVPPPRSGQPQRTRPIPQSRHHDLTLRCKARSALIPRSARRATRRCPGMAFQVTAAGALDPRLDQPQVGEELSLLREQPPCDGDLITTHRPAGSVCFPGEPFGRFGVKSGRSGLITGASQSSRSVCYSPGSAATTRRAAPCPRQPRRDSAASTPHRPRRPATASFRGSPEGTVAAGMAAVSGHGGMVSECATVNTPLTRWARGELNPHVLSDTGT